MIYHFFFCPPTRQALLHDIGTSLPVSTLRYYDKEGLFPSLQRVGNIRRFNDPDIETLRLIECLKKAGLEIREIKTFVKWCSQGPETYALRKDFFERQKIKMTKELEHMNQVMDMIRFKCWYYEKALQDGNEKALTGLCAVSLPEDMPDDIRKAYLNSHSR